ncbi:MAG: hypothetical protein ACXWWU_10440 [Candidatus Limnocylindria bacterium]
MPHSHSSAPRVGHRVALPIDVPGAPDPLGQWVVCGGAIREVTDGRVTCPLQGTAVALGECIGCHCLVTLSGERDRQTDCAIGDIS